MHGSLSLVNSRGRELWVFGSFSCFASLSSLFHFVLASIFKQERGLSLCVSTAVLVHVSCFLWVVHLFRFSALCFRVVSGAVGSVCPFWYIAFDRKKVYRICCNSSVVIFWMLTV